MRFTELKAAHEAIATHQSSKGYKGDPINISIIYKNTKPRVDLRVVRHKTFDLEKLADDASNVQSIIESNSQEPLSEWLKKRTDEMVRLYYSTIDDAVNAWMQRIIKLEGATYIQIVPEVDRHFVLFNESSCSTWYHTGPLNFKPFSYKAFEKGYNHAGYSFPRSVPIEAIKPTEEEKKIMDKYNVYYLTMESKDIVKTETCHVYVD